MGRTHGQSQRLAGGGCIPCVRPPMVRETAARTTPLHANSTRLLASIPGDRQ